MKGFKLHIWGSGACFTMPEFKTERVTYDVITPSAARNILQCIHWKPAIEWVIDRIYVLNPIEHVSLRRNEVKSVISGSKVKSAMKTGDLSELYLNTKGHKECQQRSMTYLVNPAYVVEAHFELTGKLNKKNEPDMDESKHTGIFTRRALAGQCYRQPYFGVREFQVNFKLLQEGDEFPECKLVEKDKDFGWMLWDIDHSKPEKPAIPYRAVMKNGIIEVSKAIGGVK